MSWLLVALIPGLLMLATFGLERVEAGLRRDALSPADVDEILEHAKASDGGARARVAPQGPVPSTPRRLGEHGPLADRLIEPISSPALPTRDYLQHLANTEFRQTRHANRV